MSSSSGAGSGVIGCIRTRIVDGRFEVALACVEVMAGGVARGSMPIVDGRSKVTAAGGVDVVLGVTPTLIAMEGVDVVAPRIGTLGETVTVVALEPGGDTGSPRVFHQA